MDKVHKRCMSFVLPGLQCFENRKIFFFGECQQGIVQMLCQVAKKKPVPLMIHKAG